ncbi:MAG TPA: 4-alpha-glucanotransferase [Casimicrobiaceae bacterium]|nr:4-alpha-glucanotransferase [Casimicrobiaceae bacterium]
MNGVDDPLLARARDHGIEPSYVDVHGVTQHASRTTLEGLLAALEATDADACTPGATPLIVVAAASRDVSIALPHDAAGRAWRWQLALEDGERRHGDAPAGAATLALRGPLPPGYHRLACADAATGERALFDIAACPARCHQPDALAGAARVWGIAVQLYALRSARNWGIGDFGDLGALVELAARAGAALVGVNPLHALFADHPERASPYSPSDRTALNTLYIDVEAVPEFGECDAARQHVAAPAFQRGLAALRAAPLVDYTGVAATKRRMLEELHRHFRAHHLPHATPRAAAFRDFIAAGGSELRDFARFEALREHFTRSDARSDWRTWPHAFQSPAAAEVAQFALGNAARVEFHLYLQWCASTQLHAIRERARTLGMPIGLYLDMAVGADPAGAEAWREGGLQARDVTIGAPPDAFNLLGQDWGLSPLAPVRLRDAGYRPFIAMLRAAMRHAGALRIDHVMGLSRTWWIAAGAPPDAGAYVRYPFSDLLGLVALESRRHACLVIGEDLGTVPQAVRAALGAAGVLSYRLLYFEREADGAFADATAYPRDALVAVATHDLATLAGFWQGRDLDARDALHLFPSAAARDAQLADRERDRERLLARLRASGLWPQSKLSPSAAPSAMAALALAVHRFLAATPAKVLMLQMEDVLGEVDQVNLPSTTDAVRPNWRRKLPVALEDWSRDARVRSTFAAMRECR